LLLVKRKHFLYYEQRKGAAELYRQMKSGVAAWIKMQYPIYFRGVAKSPNFKFQGGELVNIFYFKLQYLTVQKMVEQGLHFRNVNCIWQKVQCNILLS